MAKHILCMLCCACTHWGMIYVEAVCIYSMVNVGVKF